MPTQLSTVTATAATTTQVHVHPPATITPAEPVPASVSAPAVPDMETFRDQQFRDQVVMRLRAALAAGQPIETVTRDIAMEQIALAHAVTDPALLATAADLLFIAKKAAISDPGFVTTADEARDTMEQIFHRRAVEARGYAMLLTRPAFCSDMLAAAQAANDCRFTTATLQEVKFKETLDELLHRDANGEPQVLAHLDAFRDGMYITHHALAQLFQINGVLRGPLKDALAKHLPGVTPEHLQALTTSWLFDREAAASLTTQLLGNDGAAYTQAVAESKAFHQKKLGIAPSTTHVARALASKSETGLVMDV